MTIYIRTEDLDKWLSIGNKSEFIHKALKQDNQVGAVVEVIETVHKQLKPPPKVIKTKQDAVETVKQVFPEAKVIPTTYKPTNNWGA